MTAQSSYFSSRLLSIDDREKKRKMMVSSEPSKPPKVEALFWKVTAPVPQLEPFFFVPRNQRCCARSARTFLSRRRAPLISELQLYL